MNILLFAIQSAIILAEQMPQEWWVPIISGGSSASILGAIVIWFALRLERILERLRESIDISTQASLLFLANSEQADASLKKLAARLAQKLEVAQRK